MLRNLDQFGVEFPLRVGNYENFKTQSGGGFFIIYLIGIIVYFIYGLYYYFQIGQYKTTYYEESFKNNEINLKNQEFTLGFYDKEGLIEGKVIDIKSYYEEFNKNKYEIKRKDCETRNFTYEEEELNYNKTNFYCFDHKTNETIKADTSNKKYISYKIYANENTELKNSYQMRIIYPINILNGWKLEKLLGVNHLLINPNQNKVVIVYLEKNIFITDDDIFFERNTTKIDVKTLKYAIVTHPRDIKDSEKPLVDMRTRQTYSVKVKYTKRKKLQNLILEMISMATTLLANFRGIVSIFNLKKAKLNIFADIFYINNNCNDDKISSNISNIEIRELNIDNKDFTNRSMISKNPYHNNPINENILFDDKTLRKKEPRKIRERRERREKIKNFLKKRNEEQNENSLNRENNPSQFDKNIKEKMFILQKKYQKADYKNDPRFIKNIFSYTKLLFICDSKKLNEIKKIELIIDKEFANFLNIFNFIENQKRQQAIERILFNKHDMILLNHLSSPFLNIDKESNNKEINNIEDFELIYDKYKQLERKVRKTEIEKNLIEFFNERINELIK